MWRRIFILRVLDGLKKQDNKNKLKKRTGKIPNARLVWHLENTVVAYAISTRKPFKPRANSVNGGGAQVHWRPAQSLSYSCSPSNQEIDRVIMTESGMTISKPNANFPNNSTYAKHL